MYEQVICNVAVTSSEIPLVIKPHDHVGELNHRIAFDFSQGNHVVQIIHDLMR